MRVKLIMFIITLFGSVFAFSKDNNPFSDPETPVLSNQPIINSSDSIIFDLASATITATYLDLPIHLISDDVIMAVDYAIKFNLSKLTFSATIDLVIPDPSFTSLSYFNPNDLFLRYTGGSAVQNLPSNGVHTTKIRFALSAPCVSITAADFSQITAILNGIQCSSRVTDLNFVAFVPNANFNTGPTCLNSNILFSDASTVSSGTISSWQWTFDNGSTSSLQNNSTSYTTTGSASATLIATASTGCKDTIIKPFTINVQPTSSFSYSFSCIKDSVFFTNTSTIPSGTILSSQWNFGDLNGTSNLTNPTHNYNASGFYTVTLASTSDFSCTATSTLVVSLINKVSANFTTNPNNCLGSASIFNDATTYSLSTINAWAWNFGDGNTSTQQNPVYTYTGSGTYSVTLTGTGADGCKGVITKTLIINPLPIVDFGINSSTTCAVATASLNNTSISAEGSTYSWNFGNGTTSSLQNPLGTYTTSGTYSIELVITTTVGCTSSLRRPFNVFLPTPPPAPFSYNVISNAVVSFSNLTNNSVRVEWSFGDNQSSISNNPINTYPDIATYKVCLNSYDNANCISSSCKDIFVGFSKVVAVPSSFTPNRDGNNDVLKVKGGPLVEMQFQIFNEWGNLLFTSTSQDFGWDGTFRGEPQPVGVYEYILNAKTSDSKIIGLYGAVNLTR